MQIRYFTDYLYGWFAPDMNHRHDLGTPRSEMITGFISTGAGWQCLSRQSTITGWDATHCAAVEIGTAAAVSLSVPACGDHRPEPGRPVTARLRGADCDGAIAGI